MADAEYEILITGKSQELVDAAKRASAALEQTDAAVKGEAGSQEEAARATEKHGGHLREIHKLCHGLNYVVPGLGVLMQAAFAPVGAAISLALMALRLFHEKMKELNEEFRRLEEEGARPLTHRLEAQRDTVVSAAVAAAAFKDRLAEVAQGEQTTKQRVEELVAALKGQVTEAGRLEEAFKKTELGGLEAAHTAGLISESQYLETKLALEEKYLERKRQMEEREEMAGIMIRRRELEEAGLRQPELTKAAVAARAKQEKALEDVASLRTHAEIEEDKKKAEAALKTWDTKHADALAKARSAVERDIGLGYGAPGATAEEAYGLTLDRARFGPLRDERDKLQAAADLAKKQWEQAPGAEARKKVAAEAAAREAARAERQAEQNQEFITEEKRQQGLREAAFKARRDTDRELDRQSQEDLRRRPMLPTAVRDVGEGIATAHAFEQHKQVSEQSKQQLVDIASAIAGHRVGLQEAVKMMHGAARDIGSFTMEVGRLADAMAAMAQGHSALHSKISYVESEVRCLQGQCRGMLIQ
jgi:hypothetical protein